MISSRRGSSNFWACRKSTLHVPPLMVNPDLPIRKLLKIVFVLLTVMLLKRVSQIFFFKSNRLTAYKVNRGREEVESHLTVFSILQNIQPALGKKHMRT